MGLFNNLHALSVSVVRMGRGMVVHGAAKQPAELLVLYEFEACPFCRKVRDVFVELDLSFVSKTCARGSHTRAELVARGGKALFPYLIDPNTGVEMYESDDIIAYVRETYGASPQSWRRFASGLNSINAAIASGIRPKGRVTSGRAVQPEQLLELYSFEASPYCRKVRERLHELDINFITWNVGKGSQHRPQLVARGGKMMVPYLIDPNTQTEMYESDDIVAYLNQTYA